MQAPAQRQTEPSVVVFAPDPARMAGFSPIRGDARRRPLPRATSAPGRGLPQRARPPTSSASARGDAVVRLRQAPTPSRVRVRDVVTFDGAGTADAAMLDPARLRRKRAVRPRGRSQGACSSRTAGGDVAGAGRSDEVRRRCCNRSSARSGSRSSRSSRTRSRRPMPAGTRSCRSSPRSASFSIAAGILLIFLIFVMLAAERRGELGIARAVGTRRGHLVADVHVRGRGLRPRSPLSSARCSVRSSRLGMVIGDGERLRRGGRRRGAPDRVRRVAAEPRHRLRARSAPHPSGRRRLGLARQRDEHLDRDPQSPGAADRHVAGAGSCSRPSRSCSARLLIASGTNSGHRDARDARRLARAPRPDPAPAGARRVRSCSPSRSAEARSSSCCMLPWNLLGRGLRKARDGLLDLDRRRPDDHRRIDV